MKVILFEDNSKTRECFSNTILNCIKENNLNFELYLATDEVGSIRRTLNDLQETAVYFIDLVHNSEPLGIDIIIEIVERNYSDFIVVITNYPEKILFQPEIKVHLTNIIFKRLHKSYKKKPSIEQEMAVTLTHISSLMAEKNNKYLYAGSTFSSKRKIYINDIYFIETYPPNRIKIHYKNGEYVYINTLKEVMKELDENFMYCHQSFIINKNMVMGKENKEIILKDGLKCIFSERYRKKVEELFK